MSNGFERNNFSCFIADYKRASRHMLHTCKLAEQNGVAPEALASVCLEVAAELMTQTRGPEFAIETLQLTVDRINKTQTQTEHLVEQQQLNVH
jgi:hypothetical protein